MPTGKSVPIQTFFSFQSQDRDEKTWPDTNNYQIDIPKFHGVTAIKLASFEMPSMPQYTIEKNVNDTLHVNEGCIIGCAIDSAISLDANSTVTAFYENYCCRNHRHRCQIQTRRAP